MINYILNLNPLLQALIAGIISYSFTMLGSSIVFFLKKNNEIFMDSLLSVSAGIMFSAAIFSLIIPSIEMSNNLNLSKIIVLTSGLILGSFLIVLVDKIFNRITKYKNNNHSFKKCLLLILSITMHNIPEGLAIGVAFGSVIYHLDSVTILTSWMLAIGIAIQNFPEGAAISLPLYNEGLSKRKSFFFGHISGIVEPISSFIGAIIVMKVKYFLPYLLSFAAGSMIFVVVSELIPESLNNKYKNIMSLAFILGFILMTLLDIYL